MINSICRNFQLDVSPSFGAIQAILARLSDPPVSWILLRRTGQAISTCPPPSPQIEPRTPRKPRAFRSLAPRRPAPHRSDRLSGPSRTRSIPLSGLSLPSTSRHRSDRATDRATRRERSTVRRHSVLPRASKDRGVERITMVLLFQCPTQNHGHCWCPAKNHGL